MSDQQFEVQHRAEQSRFVLVDRGTGDGGSGDGTGVAQEAGEERYLDVEIDGTDGAGRAPERIFFHTVVHDAYGGQGLASQLVREAVDQTIAEGRAIVPVCPYVVAWVNKHPEVAEHVVEATPAHLRALRASQG